MSHRACRWAIARRILRAFRRSQKGYPVHVPRWQSRADW